MADATRQRDQVVHGPRGVALSTFAQRLVVDCCVWSAEVAYDDNHHGAALESLFRSATVLGHEPFDVLGAVAAFMEDRILR